MWPARKSAETRAITTENEGWNVIHKSVQFPATTEFDGFQNVRRKSGLGSIKRPAQGSAETHENSASDAMIGYHKR